MLDGQTLLLCKGSEHVTPAFECVTIVYLPDEWGSIQFDRVALIICWVDQFNCAKDHTHPLDLLDQFLCLLRQRLEVLDITSGFAAVKLALVILEVNVQVVRHDSLDIAVGCRTRSFHKTLVHEALHVWPDTYRGSVVGRTIWNLQLVVSTFNDLYVYLLAVDFGKPHDWGVMDTKTSKCTGLAAATRTFIGDTHSLCHSGVVIGINGSDLVHVFYTPSFELESIVISRHVFGVKPVGTNFCLKF